MRPATAVCATLWWCALGSPAALAQGGINLAWNDCASPYGVGVSDIRSACNSNLGANLLFASFAPPAVMPQFNGHAGVVDLVVVGPVLSPWWQLQPGGCRQGSLTADFDFTAGPFSCADVWAGEAVGGVAIGTIGNNGVRIRTVSALAEGSERNLPADGTEYYVFRLRINNAKTVGAGNCAGCLDPACIVFQSLLLTQPAGVGDYIVTTGAQQSLSWKGGAFTDCGLCSSIPCPAKSCTWGYVKSLFR